MFFANSDPRMLLQRRLDGDARRFSCCRATSDDEAPTSACTSESEEATVANRPLFARPRPQDGGEPNGQRLLLRTLEND